MLGESRGPVRERRGVEGTRAARRRATSSGCWFILIVFCLSLLPFLIGVLVPDARSHVMDRFRDARNRFPRWNRGERGNSSEARYPGGVAALEQTQLRLRELTERNLELERLLNDRMSAPDASQRSQQAPPSAQPLSPEQGAAAAAATPSLEGPSGASAGSGWKQSVVQAAEKAAGGTGRLLLTAASVKERALLVNMLIHLEMAGVRNNSLVLADHDTHSFLQMRGALSVQYPSVPSNSKVSTVWHEHKYAALLELLRLGFDVVWIDADVLVLIDEDAIWKEMYARSEAHLAIQKGSKEAGNTSICSGLGLFRSQGGFAADVVDLALSFVLYGKHEQEAFSLAVIHAEPSWLAGGTDPTQDLVELEKQGGKQGALKIAILPSNHFPLADYNRGRDLARWAYVFHHSHDMAPNLAPPEEIVTHQRKQKMFFLKDGFESAPVVPNFEEWACSVLSQETPKRVIQVNMIKTCEEEDIQRHSGPAGVDPYASWPGAQASQVGLSEGSGVNPVVMQLSQGRSGSTVSGALMLEKHPYCGMYIDELVWLVYRTKKAEEEDEDQQVAVDFFLNASQCVMNNDIWQDDEESTLSWFHKRNKYAHGEHAKHEAGYYGRENQRKVCEAIRTAPNRRAVCSKEIRFLGHVGQLLRSADERGIPFTLLYQMRDPRASVMSQMWVFAGLRHQEARNESSQAEELLQKHCRVAALDIATIQQHHGNKIYTMQVCFEALNKDPRQTLSALYASIPGFRSHPEPSLLPYPVSKYGKEHMAFWVNRSSAADIPSRPLDAPGMYYKGNIISHRYSADISRALHIDEWKLEISKPKHAGLRLVWETDPNCEYIRKHSQCAYLWENLTHMVMVEEEGGKRKRHKGGKRKNRWGDGGEGLGANGTLSDEAEDDVEGIATTNEEEGGEDGEGGKVKSGGRGRRAGHEERGEGGGGHPKHKHREGKKRKRGRDGQGEEDDDEEGGKSKEEETRG